MLFHKMLASITTCIVVLIILVNTVRTQTTSIYPVPDYDVPYLKIQTTTEFIDYDGGGSYDYTQQKRKMYDTNELTPLFLEHAKRIGIESEHKIVQERYYLVFSDNVYLINRLSNIYNTTMFSINAYTHLTFKNFTEGYTGFNGTGLRDDDVVMFNRSVIEHIPPVMDWSHDMLNIYYQESYCKNSYVLSALSKSYFICRCPLRRSCDM